MDGAPHNRENNAHRRAKEITPADATVGRQLADRIRPALEKLRERGRIEPEDIRPALLSLGVPEKEMTVQTPWSPWDEDPEESWGTAFGIRVGANGCVTGRVVRDQVWAEVNGPYPETGCLYPPTAH